MNRRQSILITFVGSSAILLLIVLIFNSLAIKRQIQDYARSTSGQKALVACNDLFQVVRHYGFERGRVNVVLNFKGPQEKIQKSIDFLGKQGELGDAALKKALGLIEKENLSVDQDILQSVIDQQLKIGKLRTRYQPQLAIPFAQRDQGLDQQWFDSMSVQIRNLGLLLYSLRHQNNLSFEQERYADIYYLLLQLRDNTGPVVSYLKSASFNIDSLTEARINEIKDRKLHTQKNLKEIKIAANGIVSSKLFGQIPAFEQFYLDDFYPSVDEFFDHLAAGRDYSPLFVDYLKNGVQALEMLNTTSEALVAEAIAHSVQLVKSQKLAIAASMFASLFVLVVIGYTLREAYLNIYRRVIDAARIVSKLSNGETEVDTPGAEFADEIGDIETGLADFRVNLIAMTDLNDKLINEIAERMNTEQQLEKVSHERGVLLKEVHHRVKNNLQVITSMLSLQGRADTSSLVSSALVESRRRINAIALAHEHIYQTGDFATLRADDFLQKVVKDTFETFGERSDQAKVVCAFDNLVLPIGTAICCGQILSELLSNALKYAFPEENTGQVEIGFTRLESGALRLRVHDNGVGFEVRDNFEQYVNTLGLRLVSSLAKSQEGRFTISCLNGTLAEIVFNRRATDDKG